MIRRVRIDRCPRLFHQGRSRRSLLAVAGGGLLAWLVKIPSLRVAAAQEATLAACPRPAPEENTALAQRWFDEAISGHDLAVLDELLAPDSGDASGARAAIAALLEGFPDLLATVQQTIAEGDQVAVRWSATGTNTGQYQSFPPTSRGMVFTGIDIFRVACGRIAQVWSEADELSLLRQLGVLPRLGAPVLALPETVETANPSDACPTAPAAENRALAARWFGEAVNPRALDLFNEIVAPEAVLHATGFPDAIGADDIAQLFSALFVGFPDLRFAVEPGPAEGDFVVERWTASGANDGVFQGVAPTGRAMSWTGINIYRIARGQIAEIWTEADTLGRMQQLGVIPAPGTTAATPAA